MNLNKRYNKTGLQPVSRPVEHVPLPLGLGGWYNFPLVPRMCWQTGLAMAVLNTGRQIMCDNISYK